jgi:hypothetical protein
VHRGVRGLAVGGDDERLLKGCGGSEHDAWPDDRVTFELDGEGLQEGVTLLRMDRRCRGLDRVVFVVGKAQRH